MTLTQNQRIQAQVNAIKDLRAKQDTNDMLQQHKLQLLMEADKKEQNLFHPYNYQ